MQFELFSSIDYSKLTEEIFTAYFDCRKNKRNTLNALKFEKHFEQYLFVLIDEIYAGTYTPGRSIAFIVNKPVKREIFAADFRDRVVHHWLINKLNPLFEKLFIEDSYACRVGKGTHYGIKHADGFIKACSENYTKDCYILKLDVQGFFMHIHRGILFDKLSRFVELHYKGDDQPLVMETARKIIFNDPTRNCIIKGSERDWEGLPCNKSLFHSPPDCGLPIGNLTSQVFANFYMHDFDAFITSHIGIKYYGRYVDDFILIHEDKAFLKSLIPKLSNFLLSTLRLTLHPNKIYLQHYTKGVRFLGTFIKPHRIYIANRTKGNFFNAIQKQNHIIVHQSLTKEHKASFLSSMNSYLGIMKHFKTYRLRKNMIQMQLHSGWYRYLDIDMNVNKFHTSKKSVKPCVDYKTTFKAIFPLDCE